jgi:F-type H+-transporting ATPase subunit b
MIQYLSHILIPIAHAAEVVTEPAAAGPIQMFGIDWMHLLAQLVNFLIIFWLLSRFIFKPLMKKMEERSHKVEQSLKNVKEIEAKLHSAEESRKAEIQKGHLEAQEIISKAQKTAEESKNQILAEAKAASEKMIEQTKKQLENEKEKLLVEVREAAATMVVTATERILREKIDLKKDEQLIKQSLQGVSVK